MRILIVENSTRMQEALRHALTPFGTVIVTGSGAEAKQALASSDPFDIVFTDYHMRNGSGLEVVDHVNEHHRDVHVVVLTAYGTKELTIECINRKVFKFLEKPVRYEDLKGALTEAMSTRERARTEKRARELGMLSNLIFHEIGGGLQDLLNETQSIDLSSIESRDSGHLAERFIHLRNSIYHTADAFRNLKFLILEGRLDPADFENVDLIQAVKNQDVWLANWTDGYQIQVEYALPDAPVVTRAQPALVERGIKNILINAVEALADTEGPRRISVELKLMADEFHLRITNNGPEIPRAMHSKLFEYGYSSREKGQVPRGIGLYVVDRLMKSFGGRVVVESNRESTSFILVFPRTNKTAPSDSAA